MTKLEQYKKAYATLVGRVDTIITDMERSRGGSPEERTALAFTAQALTAALQEAEDYFLSEDAEDEECG